MSPRLKVLCTLAAASIVTPIPRVGAQPAGGVIQPDKNAPLAAPIDLDELEKLIGGRTTLKFDFKEAKPEEVASEIARQTGFKVTLRDKESWPDREAERLSLQAEGQPFWMAVATWNRAVAPPAKDGQQAEDTGDEDGFNESISPKLMPGPGLSRKPDRDGGGFELSKWSGIPDGRAVDSWPGLFIAHRVERRQAASISSNQTPVKFRDRLYVPMQVFLEPRLTLSNSPLRCEILEAVDDKGQDLRLPWRNKQSLRVVYANQSSGALTMTLLSRPGMGRTLARLRGVVRFVIVTQTQKLEITDLQKPFDQLVSTNTRLGVIHYKGLKTYPDGATQLIFQGERTGDDLARWAKQGGARIPHSAQSMSLLQDLASNMQVFDQAGHSLPGTPASIMVLSDETGEQQRVLTSPPPPLIEKWHFQDDLAWSLRREAREPGSEPFGPPVRFVAEFPTERREVQIPFEFKDLPLPPS